MDTWKIIYLRSTLKERDEMLILFLRFMEIKKHSALLARSYLWCVKIWVYIAA